MERIVRRSQFDNIKNAQRNIANVVHKTPIMTSTTMNEETGLELFFKCENMQKTGSFKARGVTNAVLSVINQNPKTKGFVAYSSGNHGLALAWACSIQSPPVPCKIVVVRSIPDNKLKAIKRYGGEVVFCRDDDALDRVRVAHQIEKEYGYTFISTCDNSYVIAGQGTIAMELLQQVPDLDAILVPIGGGGIAAGTALAVSQLKPICKVICAEPCGKNMSQLLKQQFQEPLNNPRFLNTKAEGLRQPYVGNEAFSILCQHLEKDVVTVTDKEMANGVRLVSERLKTVIELSAGATVGAVTSKYFKTTWPNVKRVGVILSGGNINPKIYQDLLK